MREYQAFPNRSHEKPWRASPPTTSSKNGFFTRVGIVEPDPLRRCGIEASLQADPSILLVASADSVDSLVNKIPRSFHSLDLAIINLSHSLFLQRSWAIIRGLFPGLKILGLVAAGDHRSLLLSLIAGFEGLHPIEIRPTVLCNIVLDIAGGGNHNYCPGLLEVIKDQFGLRDSGCPIHLGGFAFSALPHIPTRFAVALELTHRETEILELLGVGASNRQISVALSITASTVAFHVSNILGKLEVSSRLEAGILGFALLTSTSSATGAPSTDL